MQTLTFAPRTVARFAGLMYLIIIACGLYAGLGVREPMLVPGDPAATASNILNDLFRFRLGFVADLVMALCDVAVGVAFFVLLRPLSFALSLLAAFLRLAQASVIGINLLNHFWPVLLLQPGGAGAAFAPEQLHALVMLFLQAHATGYLISGVFFGLCCLVLGYLLFRGHVVPRWIAVGIVAAGFAYLLDCTANFLFPDLTTYTELLMLVNAVAGELSLCVYLLVKGVRA